MERRIVILAAGMSSRMKKDAPKTGLPSALELDANTRPKSLIGVGEGQRPFLDYLMLNAVIAGYRDCVLVVNDQDQEIESYYRNQKRIEELHGMSISFATQVIPPGRKKPLGTADALLAALYSRPDWKGLSFTVCNSDNLYSVTALSAVGRNPHENAMVDYDRSALEFPRARIAAFAVVQKNRDGYLLNIIEKPSMRDIESVRDDEGRVSVSMNLFHFNYDEIVPCLERVPLHPIRDEKELPEAVRYLAQRGPRTVKTIPLAEHVPDLTSKEDILTIKRHLESEVRRVGFTGSGKTHPAAR